MSRGTCGIHRKILKLESAFIHCYRDLFTTGGPVEPERSLRGMESRMTPEMNNSLMKEFNCEEITVAIRQMSPQKAPRPDGFSAGIFHENWDVVGNEVCTTVLSILNSGVLDPKLNYTYCINSKEE
jgi:hypothetical protein